MLGHDSQGPDGYNALHLAARFGHADVAQALLTHGMPVDEQDNVCVRYPSYRLRGHGSRDPRLRPAARTASRHAMPDAPPQHGHTALHYAAGYGHAHVVRTLLKYGAIAGAPSTANVSAAAMARAAGYTAIAEELEAAARSPSCTARLKGWLDAIGLGQYFPAFLAQGFDDVDFLAEVGLTADDMAACNVQLAGHRKKLSSLYEITPWLAKSGEASAASEEESSDEEGSGSEEGSDEEESSSEDSD